MTDPIEIMARAMCISGGFSPDDTMPNGGPRWRYYKPGLQAALSALRDAGYVVVPVEPTEEMIGEGDRVMYGRYGCSFEVAPIYDAMIQAAQVPHDEA